MRNNLLITFTMTSALVLLPAKMQAADDLDADLTSLKQMMDTEVTSVSKREEKASQTMMVPGNWTGR